MGQWYLISRHPAGKWEKKDGPYRSKAEAEIMKDGMTEAYSMISKHLSKDNFCPEFIVVEESQTPQAKPPPKMKIQDEMKFAMVAMWGRNGRLWESASQKGPIRNGSFLAMSDEDDYPSLIRPPVFSALLLGGYIEADSPSSNYVLTSKGRVVIERLKATP